MDHQCTAVMERVASEGRVAVGVRVAGFTATAAALAGNLVVFGVAKAAGADFLIGTPRGASTARSIDAQTVAVVTVLTAAVGWVAAALAVHRWRPGLRLVAIVASGFAALSMGAPLTLDAALGTRVSLAAMHVLAGVAFVAGGLAVRRGLEARP